MSISTIFFTNCAVGPNYVKPSNKQLGIPSQWHGIIPHEGSNLQLINWWQKLNDPVLVYLIKNSLMTNPTIFIALAKIQEAQANLQSSRSFLYPNITAIGNAGITQNSMMSFTSGTNTSNTLGGNFFSATGLANGVSGGSNMSWELDLFGASRRSIEAAEARYSANKFDWNDAKVSLAAEVADVYVSLRECQSLLQIYQEEKEAQLSTQKITLLRVKAGFAAQVDVNQIAGSLYKNISNIDKQKSICEQYINQLAALTGINYNNLTTKLVPSYGIIPLPVTTTISTIPAQIINQRPDISSAERSLAAATADVGVATANRYPQIYLIGSISINSGSLYGGQSNSWSMGPSISVPLIDGGYLSAQENISYAKYEQAYANYRNKVNTAVKEVENALTRISFSNRQVIAAKIAEHSYQLYFDAYNKKYNVGWINLPNLEIARMNYLSSRENLATAQLEQIEAWIALYKAVGGGWNQEESPILYKESTNSDAIH